VASDFSGNVTRNPFTLYVKEPVTNTTPSTQTTPPVVKRTYLDDVIKTYKTDKTKIGIDVSRYQGDIDFEAVKNAGVEFAILRVGGTLGINAEYFLDAKFKQNIEGFKKVGIPVGIYFFSYAPTKEASIKDAEWVYEQIRDYDIELPVVYDWENWSFYNEFHLSFSNLTKNAEAFLDTLKRKGYDGMIYGSKNYLEKIWLRTDYPIWIAHYTSDPNVSYEQYHYWQICDNGYVDGITGNVDIDIMYIKE
jgi:GH25 family lysozyme M1 (1,4-beta-N-acetylmuramidase)